MPMIAPVAKSFVKSTATSLGEGKSIKESLKSAIAPTVHSVGKAASREIARRQPGVRVYKPQNNGKTQKKATKRKHPANNSNSKKGKFNPTNF